MKRNTKKLASGIISLLCAASITSPALAAEFDPNNIISDAEMLDSSSMSLAEIQSFLNGKGGFLASYNTKDAFGANKSAAEIIYNAAAKNYDCDGVELSENSTEMERRIKCKPITINPRLLLVLLQKEQSLLTDESPTERQLDWAVGYGCPDSQACNDRWRGFGKQMNSAALQFFDYMQNPEDYPYLAGRTYTVANSDHPASVISPRNQATASLYNYTPHVYWGNFNFHKLWNKYFSSSIGYPNRSLLQAKGEIGVWLIQDGYKRPFHSKGALTSRFDTNKIIIVSKTELDQYPTGTPIKFPQYSILRSPSGGIFLIVDDTRRGFATQEAFRKIGFNPEEIINVSWPDLNAYREGEPITEDSSYPTGALLQDKNTGGIYWVADGTKAPLWDAVLLKTKFKGKAIVPVATEKLTSYKTITPVIFEDGEILTSPASSAVFVIDKGQKRPVVSGEVFEKLGYKWENIINVSNKLLNLYPDGEPIKIDIEKPEEVSEINE